MPPKRKRKTHCTSARTTTGKKSKAFSRPKAAMKRGEQRRFNRWTDKLELLEFSDSNLRSSMGKIRTTSENKLILLEITASLRRRLSIISSDKSIQTSWLSIKEEVSHNFHIRLKHVEILRKYFFEDGKVFCPEPEKRGRMFGAIYADTKVTPEVTTTIINFMNKRHSKKMYVTASMIIGRAYDVHSFKLHRRAIGRKIALLGRTWAPIRLK